MFRYNNLVNFYRKYSTSTSFGIVIFLDSVAICLRGVIYTNTINSTLFCIYFITCCAILFLLIAILRKQDLKNILSLILLIMTIPAYSLGTIVNVNYLYDNSKPIVYSTVITEKNIYQSKITVYNVSVSPWGPSNLDDTVVVSKDLYDIVYTHKQIKIYLKSGLIGIKWYYAGT